MLLCAAVALVCLPGVASAQNLDCNSACDQYLAQEGLADPQVKGTCLEHCAKLKEMGVQGVSIGCTFGLVKDCGVGVAWDLIRHCAKPCIEFRELQCIDCFAKYSICNKGSSCAAKVCECIIKHNCNQVMRKVCP